MLQKVKKIETQKRIKFYNLNNIDSMPFYDRLSKDQKHALNVVGNILPFRVNNYVVDELIDWDHFENDPLFQLTFMQKGMLKKDQFERMSHLLSQSSVTKTDIQTLANNIRLELNPHPAGQLSSNVPKIDDEPVAGVQHKYRETALIFPSQGQMCHSYCTFCFRWPQFVGMDDLKFATNQAKTFLNYLRQQKQITDVLITGGDPMVMSAKILSQYILPLIEDESFSHIQNIRIGSKSLSYWPYRYITDRDSEEVLELFRKVTQSGKHLAFMAHVNHPNELSTEVVKKAVAKIQATGAQIRTQSPLVKNINDDANAWARMWKEQVRLGMIPYYMFVERDTGPKHYFSLPLVEALEIYQQALSQVSGLARTVRGPSMSAYPGKVCVEGVTTIYDEKVFILNMLQSRNPDGVKKPFFAKFDEKAKWLDDLKPAFGNSHFPFELD